jgi:hypothetical protein
LNTRSGGGAIGVLREQAVVYVLLCTEQKKKTVPVKEDVDADEYVDEYVEEDVDMERSATAASTGASSSSSTAFKPTAKK